MDARPTSEQVPRKSASGPQQAGILTGRWDATLETFAGIAVALVAIAVTAITTSTAWVIAVTTPAALLLAVLIYHRRRRAAQRFCQYQLEILSEVQSWQHRWQRLQREAYQTTTALSRMRDGVILLNQENEILLINRAALFLLDLSSEQDYDERAFHEVVRIPELTRALQAAGETGKTQKALVEISLRDSIRPVKARVDRFEAAGHINLLMTLRDETEAHRVDEMRREFVANISHELKTPLAAIKGYAETVELAIKDDPDAASYFMTQIQAQCQRLERLIADMMQLARAQSGRANMQITSVSLPEVVADSIKSYAPVAEAKTITLSVEPGDGQAVVRADHEALLTIANNLIGNAIHYTPAGGRVRVSCRSDDAFGTLVVEDTGVGIPESEHKRIFERFYRVEKSRSSGDGGTGIGLSVVKNLAVALGGEVSVESQPGRGATFRVRLPRARNP